MLKAKVAVILAGGKSSRMQTDKALLPFGAYNSLAEYQYRRLSSLFEKVYLSAKENKFDFEVEIISDVHNDASPLVALVSIFETLDIDEVFVLSVDAPFVNKEVIKRLYEAKALDVDVVIAKSLKGVEPLCAIYHRSFLAKAKQALEANRHRLQSLLDSLKVKQVMIEEERFFMNLNYPQEYEEAQAQSRLTLLS